eukprot:2869792-Amphidinium_carterae.1
MEVGVQLAFSSKTFEWLKLILGLLEVTQTDPSVLVVLPRLQLHRKMAASAHPASCTNAFGAR